MPIGSGIVYNTGDLILSQVSSSGTAFLETKIASATSSLIYFDSTARINSASLNSITVGTASYVSGSTSIITNLTASNISASGTGSFGIVGIGTVNPSYKLHIVGNVYGTTTGQFGNAVITGTGTGYAVYGSNAGATGVKINLDSDITRNDLVISASTGYVGIGTTSPTARLHVSGSTGGVFEVDTAGGTTTLYVSASGNVGIGTTSPVELLDIAASADNSAVAGPKVNFKKGSVNKAVLGIGGNYLGQSTNTNDLIFRNDDGNILFGFSGAEKMRISSTGNVGIGTTVPAYLLDVSGSSRHGYRTADTHYFTGSVNISGSLNATASWATNALTASYLVPTNSYTITNLTASNISASGTSSFGYVGIGTSIPSQLLELKKTTGSVIALLNYNDTVKLNINASSGNAGYIGMVSNHPLIFVNNDTERVRIDTSGNVGIGTSSPGSKLQINDTNPTLTLRANDGLSRKAYIDFYTTFFNYSADTGSRRTSTIVTGFDSGVWGTEFMSFNVGSGSANDAGLLPIERVRIDGSGNVGIGTTGPAQKLDVRGYVVSDVGSNAVEGGFYLGNGNHGLRRPGGSSNDVYLYTTSGTLYMGASGNSSQHLTILTGGNVGIGTTIPGSLLTINGTGTLGSVFQEKITNGTTTLALGTNATAAEVQSQGSVPLYLNYGGNNVCIVPVGSGNVGIGTTSPTARLHVSGSTGGIFEVDTAGGTTTLYVSASGNVGIGTSSPTQKLHVVGNVLSSYNILTSVVKISSASDAASYISVDGYTAGLSYAGTYIGLASLPGFAVFANLYIGGGFPIIPAGWSGTISGIAYANAVSLASSVLLQTSPDGSTWTTRSQTSAPSGTETLTYSVSDSATPLYVRFTLRQDSGGTVAANDCNIQNIIITNLQSLPNKPSISNRFIVNGDGNVGIGTTIPAYLLDVSGSSRHGYRTADTHQFTGSVSISGSLNATASWATNALTASFLPVGTYNITASWANNVVSASFATTAQTANALNTGNSYTIAGLTNNGTLSQQNTLSMGSGYQILATTGTAPIPGIAFVGDTNTGIYSPSADTIGFSISGSEKMRIASDGSVGIGTTSVTSELHIYKLTGPTLNLQAGSSGTDGFKIIKGDSGEAYVYNQGAYGLSIGTNNTQRIYITSGGNVGIGTSSPTARLHVSGSTGGVFEIDTAGGTTTLYVSASGNVGIGTTSPGYTLEVNGTQRTAGNFYLFNTVVNPATNFSNQRGVGFEAATGKLEVAASASTALAIGRFGSTGQILDFRYESTQIGNFSLDTNDLTLATARHLILSPTGNVGIGTTNPTAKLQVAGNISGSSFTSSISNAVGFLGTSSWAQNVVSASFATTAQTANALNASNTYTIAGLTSAYVDVNGSSAPTTGIYRPSTKTLGLSADGTLIFKISNVSSPATSSIETGNFIVQTGNVGIGTTTPNNKLHVYNSAGSSTTASNAIAIFEQSSNAGIQVCVPDASEAGLFFSRNGAAYYSAIARNGTDLTLKNNSTTAVTINSSGNVGIGTTVPSASLHVRGASFRFEDSSTDTNIRIGPMDNIYPYRRFDSYISDNTGYFWGFGQKTAAGATRVNAFFLDNNRGLFSADALRVVTFTANEYNGSIPTYSTPVLLAASGVSYINGGSVGIGTTAPAAKLEISGSSNSALLNIKSPISGAILYVSGSGAVGIGTSNVGAFTLQVSGSFGATTKSFIIDHPTKAGKKLMYGSLESPYHGIRLTGRDTLVNGKCKIQLPDYMYKLILHDSVNIQLTGIKCNKTLYVDEINIPENYFTIAYDKAIFESYKDYDFFWDFTAIRADVPELNTEL